MSDFKKGSTPAGLKIAEALGEGAEVTAKRTREAQLCGIMSGACDCVGITVLRMESLAARLRRVPMVPEFRARITDAEAESFASTAETADNLAIVIRAERPAIEAARARIYAEGKVGECVTPGKFPTPGTLKKQPPAKADKFKAAKR